MRLMNTKTGEFEEFVDLSMIPPYAIFSHTWNPPPLGEQSYQQVVSIQEKCAVTIEAPTAHLSPPPTLLSIWDVKSGLSEKILKACDIARRDGFRYIWIDSSCIDKTSSAELSEAINSMFNWYRGAQICYAFLADVPSDQDVKAERSEFRESRWFQRAWTLQELIAPRMVAFLSQDWEPFGTKDLLADLIQEITHIDRAILTHEKELAEESVAERMRWATNRKATRVEDEAYSMLGIFEITMPTLYGEGRHAFQRLQEEILQRIPDHSLFAWSLSCESISQETSSRIVAQPKRTISLFASTPFGSPWPQGRIISLSHHDFEYLGLPHEEFNPTPHGIRTQMSFIPIKTLSPNLSIVDTDGRALNWYLALFGILEQGPNDRCLLGKLCSMARMKTDMASPRVYDRILRGTQGQWSGRAIFLISLEDLARVQAAGELEAKTVYLPRPEPHKATRRLQWGHRALELSLPTWVHADLRSHGYTISGNLCQTSASGDSPDSHSITLSKLNASFGIRIQFRSMLGPSPIDNCQAVAIEARIWILSESHSPDGDAHNHTVHQTAPYTSAIWADQKRLSRNTFLRAWNITLPTRRVHLVVHSGDEVTLRLGLGLSGASRYHIYVMVDSDHAVTANGPSSAAPELSTRAVGAFDEDLPKVMPWTGLETALKLTMLGSVRQALERRGYSVHLEDSVTPMRIGVWLHVSISNIASGYTISIKYFYKIDSDTGRGLIAAAHVTVDSSLAPDDGSEPHQDGPYVVAWGDDRNRRHPARKWSYELRQIGLTTPAGNLLTLRLGLDLAWQSEYYLLIDIERNEGSSLRSEHQPDGHYKQKSHSMLREPHSSITLALPGHVKRALREQGYCRVDFEEPNETHPNCYLLTLSDANLTIAIEYSYHLISGWAWKQGLTFRACAQVLSSPIVPDDATLATQRDRQIVEWDAWKDDRQNLQHHLAGWYWILPWKDIKLTTPTGRELTLRLGFYLLWLGEYCITVEVIPRSSVSRRESLETSDPTAANGAEDTGDDEDMEELVTGDADHREFAYTSVIELEALPFSGMTEQEVWEADD
ncbi:hypothetical protein V8D89_000243 [Ganoderma adspersum]